MRTIASIVTLSIAMAWAGTTPAFAQDTVAPIAIDDPAAAKAAAEAIDPLAQAAEAEEAWALYLEVVREAGGPAAEQALALNRMGESRYYQQNMAGALEAALEAKTLLEDAGETDGEAMAEALANAAVFHGATGNPELQLPLQERSLAIRTALYGTDPSGLEPPAAKALGLGYLNYAHALYEAGRFGEAADYVLPSIDGLIQGQLTDATLFVAMSSGANMLVDAGRLGEALTLAQEGVTKATELLPEGHPFMGFAQGTLAKVLLEADRYEEAASPAREALDIMSEKLGPDHPNTMAALHNLGVIAARLGRYDEAIELMLARQAKLGQIDSGEQINSLASASNAAHEAGRDGQAMELALQAAAVAATRPPEDQKAINGLLALTYRQEEAGNYAEALAGLDKVAARLRTPGEETSDPDIEIRRGLLAIRTGAVDAGWQRVEDGTQRLTADMVRAADQFDLGADLPSYYETIMQVAEAAIVAGRPDDALKAFELASWGVNARARQYLALRQSVGDDPDAVARIDMLRRGTEQLRVLNRERAAMLGANRTADAEDRRSRIETLEAEMAAAKKGLASIRPDFARWLQPEAITVQSIQSRLQEGEALLIAMPARHRTFSMGITRDQVAMGESAEGRPAVRALVAQLRDALDGPGRTGEAFPVAASAHLHDIVMPPAVEKALDGQTRVAIVTSDALSRLPFALLLPSLPEGETADYAAMDWLARKFAFSIALTPSAAFAARDDSAADASFLGIGAPALAGAQGAQIDPAQLYRSGSVSVDDVRNLPALPATAGEVAEVAAAFGAERSVVLTGGAASERRVREESAAAHETVLFATHGLMGGEIGGLREPALVLTPPADAGDTANDGLLQASEIAALDFAARFVILSACNSAAGRHDTAPAYTGLANAFLGSGTDALMLSHWRVRDDASARLSVETVKGARSGLTRAEALRKAQLTLIDGGSGLPDASHPAVWAPFVIIGD